MSNALKILIRVIQRRVNSGENIEAVLSNYPKLTNEERDEVLYACG